MTYPAEVKQRIRYLKSMIHYQENPPSVTTTGPCFECGTPSRGSCLCPACLRAMVRRVKDKADGDRRAKVRAQAKTKD